MEQRLIEGSVVVLGSVVAFACAAWVFRRNPGSPSNRRLANVLAFEGILNAFFGLFMLMEYPIWGLCGRDIPGQNMSFVEVGMKMSAAAVPWYYLYFLGTLGTNALGPFKSRYAGWVVLGGVASTILPMLAVLAWFPPCPATGELPPYYAMVGPFLFLVASAWGLVVLTLGLRDSGRGTALRMQRTWWLIVFGTRDALYLGVIAANLLLAWVIGEYAFDPLVLPAFVVFAYVPLVVYGIRRRNLLA